MCLWRCGASIRLQLFYDLLVCACRSGKRPLVPGPLYLSSCLLSFRESNLSEARFPSRTLLGSSVNRPSVSMLTLSRQLWHLVEREEDLVGLYAHLLCRSGKLVGSWNGASQLTLTECLSGLF